MRHGPVMKQRSSLSLPSLPPLRARLCNALTARSLPCDVPANTGTDDPLSCRLAFDGSEAARQHPAPFAPAAVLYVQTGESFWKITCSSLEALALQPDMSSWRQEAQQDFSALPQGLRLAVLEHLFMPALNMLARWAECEAKFCSAALDDLPWSEPLPLVLTLPEGDTIRLRLYWSDDAAARFLLEKLEALPSRTPVTLPATAAGAFVSCPVELGEMHLALTEVSALNVGDVLLPERWTPESPCLRLPGGAAMRCRWHDGVLSLAGADVTQAPADCEPDTSEIVMIEPANSQEDTGSADVPAPEESPLLDSPTLNAIEVPVTFELASLKLRVEEIASLAPGLTFALGGDVANVPVLLRIGDRLAARGRLVDVGGMPGVQITALLPDDAQPAVEGQ